MHSSRDDARILSRPLRVHWAGWETTTHRLQQAGWQLTADQDVFQNRLRLAMKHDGMHMVAMSPYMDFRYEEAARDRYYEMPVVVMQAMARDLYIHEHGRVDWNMAAIDATPTFTENRITRIEDLCHFAAPLVRTKEIIIPNESVPELMDRILKLQQPARTDRIREAMRNPEGTMIDAIPKQHFHAQIISLAA